jgi:hypothetical protein
MKKLVLYYVGFLLLLDLGWATFISYFGGSLLSIFGSVGQIGAQNTTDLSHVGGVLLFVFALLQSFVFDFVITIFLIVGFVFYAVLFGGAKR